MASKISWTQNELDWNEKQKRKLVSLLRLNVYNVLMEEKKYLPMALNIFERRKIGSVFVSSLAENEGDEAKKKKKQSSNLAGNIIGLFTLILYGILLGQLR